MVLGYCYIIGDRDRHLSLNVYHVDSSILVYVPPFACYKCMAQDKKNLTLKLSTAAAALVNITSSPEGVGDERER